MINWLEFGLQFFVFVAAPSVAPGEQPVVDDDSKYNHECDLKIHIQQSHSI